ncbi:MAG TPA: phospholipase D-like domain-containing protein [Polyangiaceae bacterium]|jgi:cardiolipin synthase|nr:phospholipase D-like domain-containing protein [Polyangiaceae bacterium]
MPLTRVPRRFRHPPESYVAGNRVRLLRDGMEAFPVMLDAIAAAEQQVLFEMYWFDSDRTGRRFAKALSEAAQRGVEVVLLYDSLGSITADTRMFDELRKAGVKVLEFNPLAPWKRRFGLQRLSRRDHRKVLIVDAEIGFTGGLNLADQWAPVSDGGQGWRDDMIQIEGKAVRDLVPGFLTAWRRAGGEPLEREPWVTESKPLLRDGSAGTQQVRVLDSLFRHRRRIAHAYVHELQQAKRFAYISNSYFVPDPRVINALIRAARRGVDVRVMQPAVSDIEVVRYASRAIWDKLMRNGVRIFEWHRSILHAKSAVIDGNWSTIGSYNLDYVSLRYNLEINVFVQDQAFGAALQRSFLRDFADCHEVELRTFRFRSLSERLLEAIFYRLRKFL